MWSFAECHFRYSAECHFHYSWFKKKKTSFLTFSSYLIHFHAQLSIMSFVHLLVSRPLPGSPNKEVDKRHFSSIVMPRMLCPLIICMAASGAYIIVLFVCDLFQWRQSYMLLWEDYWNLPGTCNCKVSSCNVYLSQLIGCILLLTVLSLSSLSLPLSPSCFCIYSHLYLINYSSPLCLSVVFPPTLFINSLSVSILSFTSTNSVHKLFLHPFCLSAISAFTLSLNSVSLPTFCLSV